MVEGKTFSLGGKEILIKSIAQAVSVYAKIVFKIPKKIVKESQMLSRGTGGGMTMITEGFTGKNGGSCAYQNLRVA